MPRGVKSSEPKAADVSRRPEWLNSSSPSSGAAAEAEAVSEHDQPSTVATSRSVSPSHLCPSTVHPGLAALSAAAVSSQSSLLGLLLKHATEDLNAYTYERDYCNHQLRTEGNLTPQEARMLRLRVLDADHQIRRCKQKTELIHFEASTGINPSLVMGEKGAVQAFVSHQTPVVSPTLPEPIPINHPESEVAAVDDSGAPAAKRRRRAEWTNEDYNNFKLDDSGDNEDSGVQVTRLGFWKCRLCTTEKYLRAGPGRQPSGPCKWPLKDVAKMIAHFTEMHHEHTPRERCAELGAALDKNRGPFEYWLRRSHSMSAADNALIEECVSALRAGKLPALLRKLSRAAASFPEH
ncbi:hypothetical protein TD95_000255 [Thielaviopsis punctulata]|uniref:Uncharacterized protein n=1 Tax=Thielaviopsis punctulata TaxID=72032 RepID=A0A0F4ZEA0_9PEZI|nr:hypothetical protein TD95_000255 [Thielaviopsis punctulata]